MHPQTPSPPPPPPCNLCKHMVQCGAKERESDDNVSGKNVCIAKHHYSWSSRRMLPPLTC
jgi:hypothetical protein